MFACCLIARTFLHVFRCRSHRRWQFRGSGSESEPAIPAGPEPSPQIRRTMGSYRNCQLAGLCHKDGVPRCLQLWTWKWWSTFGPSKVEIRSSLMESCTWSLSSWLGPPSRTPPPIGGPATTPDWGAPRTPDPQPLPDPGPDKPVWLLKKINGQ